MVRWGSNLLLVLGATAAAASPPGALTEATKALSELRYEAVPPAAKRALATGRLEADELAALYLVWAEAEASMGNAQAAAELFGRALELRPATLLPSSAPPKVQRPFSQAAQSLGGAALDAEVQSSWLSDGRVRTTLAVSGDARELVASAVLLPAPDEVPLAFSQVPRGEVTWACGAVPCRFTVELLDASSNRLRRLGTPASPLTFDRPVATVAAAPAEARAGGFRRAWPFVAAAAALGVAAGLLGWQLAQTEAQYRDVIAHRSLHAHAEVVALDRTSTGLQAGTVAALVLTGGLGVVAFLVW
ncbi:MAG: hypothetical protein IPJ65_27645 [Archangiaceae bacterium]|nr:hypothetical protein [Archangiaceae bacterium]